ncbi:MAG: hypothetical protein IJW66_01940 [Clostridia bacterium]|nr:hypothetical protein [Clostridia bacterium]
MKPFKIFTEVNTHDVDFNGVARTSSILRYLQSAAQAQLTASDMSYDSLIKRKRAFILSRITLEILKPIREATPLSAISFPSESRGYSFMRCYGLEVDGEPVARAVSVWALVDTDTRALVRASDFDLRLPVLPQIDLALEHIRLPKLMTEVGGYDVRYGDVDRNMHMNNTRYPDMYASFLPMSGKMIRRISINYAGEAPIGEHLTVHMAGDGDTYYFRTIKKDNTTNSEAKVELIDIS